MTRKEQAYDDIPGTFVFDAERSRQGYSINMFCMSLMKDENRKAFKADEAGYLKRFHLTPAQEDAILKRDYNRMLELGGNIYFTAKLGATDGHSFQHLAAVMTGSTPAGLRLDDAGRRPFGRRQPQPDRQGETGQADRRGGAEGEGCQGQDQGRRQSQGRRQGKVQIESQVETKSKPKSKSSARRK